MSSAVPNIKKQAWIVVGLFFAMFFSVVFAQFSLWRVNLQTQEILDELYVPKLVDEWDVVLNSDKTSFAVGEDIPMAGRFKCSEDAASREPVVVFFAAIIENADTGVVIARPEFRPTNISAFCSPEGTNGTTLYSQFVVEWDESMIEAASEVDFFSSGLEEPGVSVFYRIMVSADNWETASTETPVFTLTPA